MISYRERREHTFVILLVGVGCIHAKVVDAVRGPLKNF